MAKVREAIAKPKHDEEIRQIAYKLWLDESCPDGRHVEHWLKAESIWRARQDATQPDRQRRPKAVPAEGIPRKANKSSNR